MISGNVRPSSVILIKATVPPQSLTAAAAATGWVDTAGEMKTAFSINLGSVATGATVTVSAQQSAAADGSNPKVLNINGAATAAYADTTDNTGAILDLDPVDIENGFRWVKVTVTAAGAGAAALVGGQILGVGPRHETGLNPSTT